MSSLKPIDGYLKLYDDTHKIIDEYSNIYSKTSDPQRDTKINDVHEKEQKMFNELDAFYQKIPNANEYLPLKGYVQELENAMFKITKANIFLNIKKVFI